MVMPGVLALLRSGGVTRGGLRHRHRVLAHEEVAGGRARRPWDSIPIR